MQPQFSQMDAWEPITIVRHSHKPLGSFPLTFHFPLALLTPSTETILQCPGDIKVEFMLIGRSRSKRRRRRRWKRKGRRRRSRRWKRKGRRETERRPTFGLSH